MPDHLSDMIPTLDPGPTTGIFTRQAITLAGLPYGLRGLHWELAADSGQVPATSLVGRRFLRLGGLSLLLLVLGVG